MKTTLMTIKKALILAITLPLSACSLFGASSVNEPNHRVLMTDGQFSIRSYPSLVLASTADTNNNSFRHLFKYISGNNKSNTKIKMTAPVINQTKSQKIPMTAPVLLANSNHHTTETMSFIMPSNFTLDNTPTPLDPQVKISMLPAQKVAVLRFSGSWRASKVAKLTDKLKTWILSKKHTIIGAPRLAIYNEPWTLPPFRRNEIQIPIR